MLYYFKYLNKHINCLTTKVHIITIVLFAEEFYYTENYNHRRPINYVHNK